MTSYPSRNLEFRQRQKSASFRLLTCCVPARWEYVVTMRTSERNWKCSSRKREAAQGNFLCLGRTALYPTTENSEQGQSICLFTMNTRCASHFKGGKTLSGLGTEKGYGILHKYEHLECLHIQRVVTLTADIVIRQRWINTSGKDIVSDEGHT